MVWLFHIISQYIIKYILSELITEWREKITDIHSELDEMTRAYTKLQRELTDVKKNLNTDNNDNE